MMEHRITKIIPGLAILFLLTGSIGCYYDNEEELYPFGSCDTTNVTYNLTITPIIQQSCYSCHSISQAPVSGGNITLEGHANLSAYISANQQIFLDAIKHTGTASPMPKSGGALSTCDIKKIQTWIHAGMPNN